MKQQGKLGYSLYAVSIDGGLIITQEGIGIATAPISDFADAGIDTIATTAMSSCRAIVAASPSKIRA